MNAKLEARKAYSADYEALISNPLAIRYAVEFMLQTGLLGQFRNCEIEAEPDHQPVEPDPELLERAGR